MSGAQIFFAIAGVMIALASLIMRLASTPPKTAASNLSEWATTLKLRKLALLISAKRVDDLAQYWGRIIQIAAFVVLVISGALWLWPQSGRLQPQTTQSTTPVPAANPVVTDLPPIPKTDSSVYGWLKPANYPTPPNGCDHMPVSSDRTKVLIGDNAIGFDGNRQTIILQIKECPALVIKKTDHGVLFDAHINDGAGISPVTIIDNAIVAQNGETYSAKQSEDESSIIVVNKKTGKVLLDAQFLNATTVSVRGQFGCLGGPSIAVKDDQPIPGVFMSGTCSMNSHIGIKVD
jgi:hypothetical protein